MLEIFRNMYNSPDLFHTEAYALLLHQHPLITRTLDEDDNPLPLITLQHLTPESQQALISSLAQASKTMQMKIVIDYGSGNMLSPLKLAHHHPHSLCIGIDPVNFPEEGLFEPQPPPPGSLALFASLHAHELPLIQADKSLIVAPIPRTALDMFSQALMRTKAGGQILFLPLESDNRFHLLSHTVLRHFRNRLGAIEITHGWSEDLSKTYSFTTNFSKEWAFATMFEGFKAQVLDP